MIINNDYIISRMIALRKAFPALSQWQKPVLSHHTYQNIPEGLRKVIYSVYNPFYVYYKGKKYLKSIPENVILFNNITPWPANFIQYCLKNTIYFDTHDFFSEEDEVSIQRYIDYRIKSFLECSAEAMNEEQLESSRLWQSMNQSIKKQNEFYVLQVDNKKYYLSQNQFEPGVWYKHYGLKQLPDKVKDYIANKDFLDIGAFTGDSALMFLQYQPLRVFAYEPVACIYQDLIKTIKHEGNSKIQTIKKGIGDKEITMKIAIQGSGSTLCNDVANAVLPTEQIELTTIDAECKDKKVGLIKMDIEGFEYFAIKGGLETIKRDKPVLLISIYHTAKDFFEIPPMIKSCVPEYTFRYLDLLPDNAIAEKILAVYID